MFFRTPWTRQPQFAAQVDYGFAKPLLVVTPIHKLDLRIGYTGTLPMGRTGTNYGIGYWNRGSDTFGSASGILTDSAGAGSVSAVNKSFSISFVVTSNAAVEGIATAAATAVSGTCSFLIQNNAGTIRVYNGSVYTDMGPAVIGKLHTVSWSYEDFSPYTFRMYFDGVYKGSTTGYRNDWDAYALYLGSGFGGISNNLRWMQALLIQGAHTDLSHEWHRAYGNNPFRLFQPLPQLIWAPSAAASNFFAFNPPLNGGLRPLSGGLQG